MAGLPLLQVRHTPVVGLKLPALHPAGRLTQTPVLLRYCPLMQVWINTHCPFCSWNWVPLQAVQSPRLSMMTQLAGFWTQKPWMLT